ncbi:tRNA uridine-5-carboxymethylaminomethyl(34) synthesis GTPase MnmE [Roseibium sp. RKSG952]|uniref:tRNA uridine-5-carboxymethylaminomethyl(34) synthesis GTPase MnmE n=1 Tax=Roseibium sp. RKSG952 TaxID=2529384 RepID=UPI0012BD41CD|nr:tRNA uridine-5-carboxymethylaminomethyl(34) synthesis GTPase MnmE [Roseibium sp. RKSG952]MTI01091.1 tRNA uridine-5-carboxymethylaminomethyl(34) synthesis GTPase MnmE [Roseibium sp. RKSG952]
MTETIYALSSGSLPAGVAVIRLSGPQTRTVLVKLAGLLPEPRQAVLRRLKNPGSGDLLDEALVLYFQAPKSFTGEDVAELHCHGGRAVVAAVLETLSGQTGCRPAEPGEFTRRAFYNGRLDLTEVEGLSDLIASETEMQRKQALRQMSGALGSLYEGWRKRLIQMRAMIEADFDFADEEDVPGSVADEVWREADALASEINIHLKKSRNAERIRSGIQVVLMGAPNAGKSSLMNALAGRDVAIVTEEAGTTRDIIEVHLDLFGYPVTLVDTAGLRETEGLVEREGIRRALDRGRGADLVLWLEEPGGLAFTDADPELLGGVESAGVPIWNLKTKQDHLGIDMRDLAEVDAGILVSTQAQDGLEALLKKLAVFAEQSISIGESPLATRDRHRYLLEECGKALAQAVANTHFPPELRAEDLRKAAVCLGTITGRIDVEDLLDVIFRDFCIGK